MLEVETNHYFWFTKQGYCVFIQFIDKNENTQKWGFKSFTKNFNIIFLKKFILKNKHFRICNW